MTAECESDTRARSRFSLAADLRTPLPAFEGLDHHPIGTSSGRKVFLCHEPAAIEFLRAKTGRSPTIKVEHSLEFSDHYGQRVYLCFE